MKYDTWKTDNGQDEAEKKFATFQQEHDTLDDLLYIYPDGYRIVNLYLLDAGIITADEANDTDFEFNEGLVNLLSIDTYMRMIEELQEAAYE